MAADHSRYEEDPARVAIVLPGGGYTPAHPLLHYARAVLLRHHWTVQEVWWTPPSFTDEGAAMDWVEKRASEAIAGESAGRIALVGKSMGTRAATITADRGIPAIWLTPPLAEAKVAAAIARASAPTLLIGGTADRAWSPDAARKTRAEMLEIPDANHAMEIEGDPLGSVEVLRQVVRAMYAFVGGL